MVKAFDKPATSCEITIEASTAKVKDGALASVENGIKKKISTDDRITKSNKSDRSFGFLLIVSNGINDRRPMKLASHPISANASSWFGAPVWAACLLKKIKKLNRSENEIAITSEAKCHRDDLIRNNKISL